MKLNKIIWSHKNLKIKEKTSNKPLTGLKDVDILSKITSLQCS